MSTALLFDLYCIYFIAYSPTRETISVWLLQDLLSTLHILYFSLYFRKNTAFWTIHLGEYIGISLNVFVLWNDVIQKDSKNLAIKYGVTFSDAVGVYK